MHEDGLDAPRWTGRAVPGPGPSLPRPAVYGFEVADDGSVSFTLLRRRQTLEEIVAEAGGDPASAYALTSEHPLV